MCMFAEWISECREFIYSNIWEKKNRGWKSHYAGGGWEGWDGVHRPGSPQVCPRRSFLFLPNWLWVWEEILKEFFIFKPKLQDSESLLNRCQSWLLQASKKMFGWPWLARMSKARMTWPVTFSNPQILRAGNWSLEKERHVGTGGRAWTGSQVSRPGALGSLLPPAMPPHSAVTWSHLPNCPCP